MSIARTKLITQLGIAKATAREHTREAAKLRAQIELADATDKMVYRATRKRAQESARLALRWEVRVQRLTRRLADLPYVERYAEQQAEFYYLDEIEEATS
jgi:hypothetical protein